MTDLDRQECPLHIVGVRLEKIGDQVEVRSGEVMPVKFACRAIQKSIGGMPWKNPS